MRLLTASSPETGIDFRHRWAADDDFRVGQRGLGDDADALEKRGLLVGGDVRAEQSVDPGRPKRDLRRIRLARICIDASGGHRAAGPVGQQLGDAVGPDAGEPELLALLESEAGLGAQPVPLPRPADVDRVEDGRLHDDLARRLAHLARCAAHDPGNADGALGIGDDEGFGIEGAHHVVERLELFARARPSDDDPAAVDGSGVEGMGRLAHLEHHVVRRVDDVADRAHAGGPEAHLDPVGRGSDGRVGHPSSDEPRTELGLLHLHGESPVHRLAGFGEDDLRPAERRTRRRRDFSRQTDQRQGIAAVRFDIDVQDDVAVELREVDAQRRIRGQDQDAIGVAGQVQLVAGAQHAVADDAHLLGATDLATAGQNGAREGDRHPLARGDVRRAADDLERRVAIAEVHRRQAQAVGPRMTLHRHEFTDDDVAPFGAPSLEALDLHPEKGQTLGELLRGQVDVDVVAEPREGDPHRNCSIHPVEDGTCTG